MSNATFIISTIHPRTALTRRHLTLSGLRSSALQVASCLLPLHVGSGAPSRLPAFPCYIPSFSGTVQWCVARSRALLVPRNYSYAQNHQTHSLTALPFLQSVQRLLGRNRLDFILANEHISGDLAFPLIPVVSLVVEVGTDDVGRRKQSNFIERCLTLRRRTRCCI
jgi:hypothetical protein